MIQLNLRKILLKPKILAIIEQLQEQLKTEISICDTENHYLLGQYNPTLTNRYSLKIEGKILGWLYSKEENFITVGRLLNFILQQEFEKNL